MARIRPSTASESGSRPTQVLLDESSPPHKSRTALPSPTPSSSSDKENRRRTRETDASMERPSKRHRSNNGPISTETQEARMQSNPDLQYYDPNQDIDERRQVRRGLRELNREAADLRQEWLAPGSTGLKDAVLRADSIYQSVRQTSDATMDSRLLVTVGDLTYKKTQQVSLGDGAQGIDVDEFVSKCISFMNRGTTTDGQTQSATQRRRRQADADSDVEGGLEQGDALNWSWFGAKACFPSNSRPPVPGFLLGPLSLQKRARTQTQRRARLQRQGPVQTTRPEELAADDLNNAENQTLTTMCKAVKKRFYEYLGTAERQAEGELTDDMTEQEVSDLLNKYSLTSDGGVSLFRFAINPTSFGQTIENLFYISFLIKEGNVGARCNEDGLPALYRTGNDEEGGAEQSNANPDGERRQAVFSLDFETWQELVEVFDIQNPLIPDRTRDGPATQVGARGWYS